MPEQHWSQTREVTRTWGIGFLLAVFRFGGRSLFHATLWPVVFCYWLLNGHARRASTLFLSRAFACRREKRPLFASLRHFFRFADTILDKILAASGSLSRKDLVVINSETLHSSQTGGIIVTSHTGCLELCQVLAHLPNAHRMHVLVHTAHAAKFNTIIARFNPAFQASQIEVTSIGPDTAIRLSEYIERGDLVAIAGDRTAIGSESSLVAPFLGHEAPFPVGPFILSMLLHCPVWSMICTRDPQRKARYKVTFQRLATPDHIPRTKRQEHLQNVVNAWANELSERILESPYDWFNFFDFWNPSKQNTKNRQKHSFL